MLIQKMPLEEIDLENETFRISEILDSTAILSSIREVGQLNPVLLLEQKARKVIVCGFRRVRALVRSGAEQVLVRTLAEQDSDPAHAFLLALWDNLSHRQLDALEKARILFTLRNRFGVPEEDLMRTYLPLVGLNPTESVLRSYLLLHAVRPVLRQCLADGRLTLASVSALSEMPDPVQDGIGSLLSRIRLSASLQRQFLDLLKDIAEASGSRFSAPLEGPEALEIVGNPGLSAFQKGERLYGFLYRLRNPRLSQALERFAAQKKMLGLPGTIQITAHPFFEEPGVRIEFAAPDLERLRSLAAKLQEAAQKPEAAALFTLK